MISPIVNRNLFLEKWESKTPITLRNLSKSSKSRINFFNLNYGSNIEPCNNIGFRYNPQQVMYTISEVLDMSPSGKVYCGPTKVGRLARAGMLADTKNTIKISVWGTLAETINDKKT